MGYQFLAVVAAVTGIIGGSASADGLIFQIPPDGTWARYELTMEGEFGVGEGPIQKLRVDGTLTISSVGKETRNEQECRWIELMVESKAEGAHPKLLLKVLVPEDRLGRGQDPLSHAILTFFNPKPVDAKGVESFIDEGFNRIQYEIDRFRDVFPGPLLNPETVGPETIETKADRFEGCEVLTGTSDYDGPL